MSFIAQNIDANEHQNRGQGITPTVIFVGLMKADKSREALIGLFFRDFLMILFGLDRNPVTPLT